MNKIVLNYLYNTLYQATIMILPFITVPYVSRVLGVEGIGINSFSSTIMLYFVFFGSLGINTYYGNRTVAYYRDNIIQRSTVFWELFYLKTFTTILSILFFLIFLFFVEKKYQYIYLLQAINLFVNILDISWFFIGLEDFKKTVSRSIFVKIFGVILIFIFVKSATDLWKYIFILNITNLLGNIVMWVFLIGCIKFVKITFNDLKKHIKPVFTLFLPQIAVQLYGTFDRTLLGLLSNFSEVGFYDMTLKIVNMSLPFVTSLSTVLLPKISNLFINDDNKKIQSYIVKSFKFTSFLSIPMAFGFFAVANSFVPWFLGSGFLKTVDYIRIVSPIVIFISWSGVTGAQILIPMNKQKGYIVSVLVGAVISLVLNLILIPLIKGYGACISILVSQFFVFLIQFKYAKNYINIKEVGVEILKFFASATLMLIFIYFINYFLPGNIFGTIVDVLCGIVIYFLSLLVLKSEINYFIFAKLNEILMKNIKKGAITE